MSASRVVLLACLASALLSCNTGPRRFDGAIDPQVYTVCQDPEGDAAWQRARTAMLAREDAVALAELTAVIRRCPDLVRAHLAYQDVARRVGGADQQAMIDFYLRSANGDSTVIAYCRARLAETSYAQNNALAAILAKDPSFAWAHLSQARVTRRQGRQLQALDMYAAAIVNDPQLHEARRERAQVLVELGREEEAAIDYRDYLASCPEDIGALRDYVSLLLYRLPRIDDAIALLDKLEAKLPRDVSVRMDRAAAMWRAKRLREAIDAYLGILAESPTTVRAALNIGMLYYEIVPQSDDERRVYWPRARAAFRWFLDGRDPSDGHEQFERTLGVPFRMERIELLVGPEPLRAVRLDDLHWPTKP